MHQLGFRTGAADTADQVLVAVALVTKRGQFGEGHVARQVQQVLQSTVVGHDVRLNLVDRGEFWDGDELLFRDWAGTGSERGPTVMVRDENSFRGQRSGLYMNSPHTWTHIYLVPFIMFGLSQTPANHFIPNIRVP